MSQATTTIADGSGAAVLAAINAALQTLITNSSGASAPATTVAYQFWADTTTGLLKIRNAANSAWITVGDMTAANLGLQVFDSLTAKLGTANVWTKNQRPAYLSTDTISATGSYTYDGNTKGQINLIMLTNASTITMAAPTNIVEGAPYTIQFKAGDTAVRTVAWNAAYQGRGGAAVSLTSLTTTNGGINIINFIGGASNTMIEN